MWRRWIAEPPIRIGPTSGIDPARLARQFNVEFRVADATASPYLALAVLVQAGLDGVRRRLEIDMKSPPALPTTLSEALGLLEENQSAADWLGADFHSAYLAFKRAELHGLKDLDENEICRRYAEAY